MYHPIIRPFLLVLMQCTLHLHSPILDTFLVLKFLKESDEV